MEGRLTAALAVVGCLGAAGCGKTQPAAAVPTPTAPLPTAGLAGRSVTVYPLTLLVADEVLGWGRVLGGRRDALARSDSLIGAFLTERAPEVTWILPPELRRAARGAPGMLANPDQMATALLRAPSLKVVPDPLRGQMRTLTGVAGDRHALVPASLVFRRAASGQGEAELTLVITDVRTGLIGWRSVARGEGDDPWRALRVALGAVIPGPP